ncbi:hypothetical protein OG709_11510 [Streptomyces sp. NBC_01267]|uniref:hypothetical protein n=1 Tax=unclassified Streptomyces TaxID=2593676 RepID=UPI002024C863|nr:MULTISPECIES: hypothetical protein [unclassified Streptomyces]MCX4551052.1 hypothetical protein [Streptomyces sp. NBC_01500]WSV56305.1 hypothetical protein OG282_22905 [Streptomyces sp. NBC_01014]
MTARLAFADAGEAADLAAFLARLIHYDRAAAVRLQARADGGTGRSTAGSGTAGSGTEHGLAVFGRPPSFEVLAVRTARLAIPVELDVTVSAGELLESVDESGGTATVPGAVTGPPWAGVLPPRGGWQQLPGLPSPDALRAAVAAVVAEFRTRTEALTAELRTRAELDRIGREIWSRPVGDTGLPVRALHAAQSLGFLRPVRVAVPERPVETGRDEPFALFGAGSWLRLRTPYGSTAVRSASALGGLSVTPA